MTVSKSKLPKIKDRIRAALAVSQKTFSMWLSEFFPSNTIREPSNIRQTVDRLAATWHWVVPCVKWSTMGRLHNGTPASVPAIGT